MLVPHLMSLLAIRLICKVGSGRESGKVIIFSAQRRASRASEDYYSTKAKVKRVSGKFSFPFVCLFFFLLVWNK